MHKTNTYFTSKDACHLCVWLGPISLINLYQYMQNCHGKTSFPPIIGELYDEWFQIIFWIFYDILCAMLQIKFTVLF